MNLLTPYQRARILLLSASIVCFCIFWWTGVLFRIPLHPGYEASLLQQPASTLLVVAIVLAACAAIGTAIAGMVRYDAGLLAGAIGLAALSARGGASDYTIFWGLSHVGSPRIFLMLLFETAGLAVMVGACAWALGRLYRAGILKDRECSLPPPHQPSAAEEISTLAIQTLLTGLCVLLLSRSTAKQQALAAVGISAFAGAALSASFFPVPRRSWCWLPPMVVGMIGYAAAYRSMSGAPSPELGGALAALAYPLPLDYASAGPAGAVLGYWMARNWAREHQANNESSTARTAR